MILRRGVNGLLGQLANEGLITAAQLEPAKVAALARRAATPWFVRVLIGAGAWVSAMLIGIVFALMDLFRSAPALFIFGALLYAGGAFLRRVVKGDFSVQFSLAAGLAGAGMMIASAGVGSNENAVVVLASFVVSTVTVVVFPDVVMRFLATGVVCLTLVLGLHEAALGPDGAVAVVAIAAGLAWHFEPRLLQHPWSRPLQRPVAWGLVVSLLAFQLSTVIDGGDDLRVGPAASVSVALALLVLVFALAREQSAPVTSEPVLVALTAAVVLGAVMLRSPGVLAALYVAVLAFHRRSPVMLGLAMLFLVVFLVNFYFRMEVTLLSRSLVLLASGALLLGLREYVRRRFGPVVVEELP